MRMLIEGAIRNKAFSGFRDDNGRDMTRKAAKAELERLRDAGHKYMLLGEPEDCPNFDPITGCPGHDDESNQ